MKTQSHRRQRLHFSPVTDSDMLDPETDEILLGLLARDAEQPPIHDRPHRRWVAPPFHGVDDEKNWFHEIKPGWWRIVGPAEQKELEKGRLALERERRERAAAFHAEMVSPYQKHTWRYDEPVDRFVENLRANPASRMPDWLIEDMRRNGELWPPSS